MLYPNFKKAIHSVTDDFINYSYMVHPQKWQGVDVSHKPEMVTHELLNFSFKAMLEDENLERYRQEIKPNLPWADDHFLERVCGEPINPGKEWANWPWGNSADKFRDANGQFNHNYMERYWPKYAGLTLDGTLQPLKDMAGKGPDHVLVNKGIRYLYGDLKDVIDLLAREPETRQAYFPIFFPEDTGAVHGSRLPCTLGYHFIKRNGYLHIVYYLRSCDIYRHFRDDIYLTVRLLLYVLEELRKRNKAWNDVKPGTFTMHMTSLHCFKNDMVILKESHSNNKQS